MLKDLKGTKAKFHNENKLIKQYLQYIKNIQNYFQKVLLTKFMGKTKVKLFLNSKNIRYYR